MSKTDTKKTRDEALQKLKSKEVYDKAYSSCMTGTEDEVGKLYEKLH